VQPHRDGIPYLVLRQSLLPPKLAPGTTVMTVTRRLSFPPSLVMPRPGDWCDRRSLNHVVFAQRLHGIGWLAGDGRRGRGDEERPLPPFTPCMTDWEDGSRQQRGVFVH